MYQQFFSCKEQVGNEGTWHGWVSASHSECFPPQERWDWGVNLALLRLLLLFLYLWPVGGASVAVLLYKSGQSSHSMTKHGGRELNIQTLSVREDTRNLRGKLLFKEKPINTTLRGHSVSAAAVNLWNRLQDEVRFARNLKVLKHEIRCAMLSYY